MVTWLSRITNLRRTFDRWRENPYLRGRAAQTIGVALVADGFIGIDNPLSNGSRRLGLLSAAVFTVVGLTLVLFLPGALAPDAPFDGGRIVTGVVGKVAHASGEHASSCSATVEYSVGGRTYEVDPSYISSDLCSIKGQQVDVSYLPENPAAGRPQLDLKSPGLIIFVGMGWLILGIGGCTLVLRLAEIIVGCRLLLIGRRLVRDNEPVPAGRMLDELRSAWEGREPLSLV